MAHQFDAVLAEAGDNITAAESEVAKIKSAVVGIKSALVDIKSAVAVLKSEMEAEERKLVAEERKLVPEEKMLAKAEANLAWAHSVFVKIQEEREKEVAAVAAVAAAAAAALRLIRERVTMPSGADAGNGISNTTSGSLESPVSFAPVPKQTNDSVLKMPATSSQAQAEEVTTMASTSYPVYGPFIFPDIPDDCESVGSLADDFTSCQAIMFPGISYQTYQSIIHSVENIVLTEEEKVQDEIDLQALRANGVERPTRQQTHTTEEDDGKKLVMGRTVLPEGWGKLLASHLTNRQAQWQCESCTSHQEESGNSYCFYCKVERPPRSSAPDTLLTSVARNPGASIPEATVRMAVGIPPTAIASQGTVSHGKLAFYPTNIFFSPPAGPTGGSGSTTKAPVRLEGITVREVSMHHRLPMLQREGPYLLVD